MGRVVRKGLEQIASQNVLEAPPGDLQIGIVGRHEPPLRIEQHVGIG
jgi:hypothetical protein